MGKKKTNNIVRIQKAVRASKSKFTTTLKDSSRECIPGELKTTIIEHPPSVPCGDECNTLQEILSTTPGVLWKPRKRKEYIIDSSQLKSWQIIGFEHYTDYIGYCLTWGLSHLAPDILFNDHKGNYND
ncbi:TPA: hypothetical protein RQP16_002314 [Klebsiella michiganensis]|uniref:hypothetical protein n=1 Tax=Klebsiella michiganensis TaxID=1134687 RepID=UPI0009073597|nr:hypothetical protein [Klebsiella michiganensis]EKQ6536092.1 hypothetical protein [Klebsiella michiganensis]ELQ7988135.1 hypothetical protein [Klebsiella michiganensis]MBZ7916849.1 hypothetical protein [Klebsiella michiganensis]MCW9597309.1 hypothetical protein [Klebsiella michiganensis]HDX9238810.1 hypothetical protein [Klebsiella michiganensis]